MSDSVNEGRTSMDGFAWSRQVLAWILTALLVTAISLVWPYVYLRVTGQSIPPSALIILQSPVVLIAIILASLYVVLARQLRARRMQAKSDYYYKQLESQALSADKKTQLAKDRDDKINNIKNMEREINELLQTRENQLREQALRMREGIVKEDEVQVHGFPAAVGRSAPSDEYDAEFEIAEAPLESPSIDLKPASAPSGGEPTPREFEEITRREEALAKLLQQLRERRDDEDGLIYPVWFGTNRRPTDANDFSKGYTNERGTVTFGRVDVLVPKAHRFGETGSSFFKRLKRLDLRDDRLAIENIFPRTVEEMWEELREEMRLAKTKGETPHGLIFLHGYNTTFRDAAIRCAQLGVDLKVTGAAAFFSWPSLGIAAAYQADEATIEASEGAIRNFLVDFAKNSGADKVHVIAHSMGNRALLRALQQIASDAEARTSIKFGQIFLAAPDVDRDLFLQVAKVYPQFSERTTLYASNADLAVYLSGKLHLAPRAGYFLPYTVVEGIDSVAVPNFNVELLGHGYFAKAEALLHDMYTLLRRNDPPNARQRIERLDHERQLLWQFRR